MKRLAPVTSGYSLFSHFFCTFSWTSVIFVFWSKLIAYT